MWCPWDAPRVAVDIQVSKIWEVSLVTPLFLSHLIQILNRGVSPPHGDVLFPAEKYAKRLLLAEGTIDSFVNRRCHAVTVPALPAFCGAHPLGAPRLSADFSILPKTHHSAFGMRLAFSASCQLPVPVPPEPDG